MRDKTETHQRENNEESEQHLQANQKKFSRQCLKIIEILSSGKTLTTLTAPSYGILSLPRRILDLKENGVVINDRWLLDDKGKQTVKEWFMVIKTRPTKKQITEKWQNRVKESKSKWSQINLL